MPELIIMMPPSCLLFLFTTFTDVETAKFCDLLFHLAQMRLSYSGLVFVGSDPEPSFSSWSVECQCCGKEGAITWLRMAKKGNHKYPYFSLTYIVMESRSQV